MDRNRRGRDPSRSCRYLLVLTYLQSVEKRNIRRVNGSEIFIIMQYEVNSIYDLAGSQVPNAESYPIYLVIHSYDSFTHIRVEVQSTMTPIRAVMMSLTHHFGGRHVVTHP